MNTDPRFVNLVLLEVRMHELRELITELNRRLSDYEFEHKELYTQISNTNTSLLNK